MKTRSLVTVVLSLLLLVTTAPPSAAHVLQSPTMVQPSSLNELTIPAGAVGSPAVSSPSVSLPCKFPGYVTAFYEGFDSVTAPVLPPGWASSPISGTMGVWRTNAGTNQPAGTSAASPPNLVYFNSYSAFAGQTARLYRTAALDLRRYKDVFLCLRWYRDSGYSGSDDRVQPQVSTNGGSTWTNVGILLRRYDTTPGWWSEGMSIDSVVAGQSSVYLGFLGISEYGNDIHLDDIQVTAIPSTYLPLIVR